MKNIFKRLLLALLVAISIVGCAKLYEDVEVERIQRPSYDIDIPTNPPWDSIPQPDTIVGK